MHARHEHSFFLGSQGDIDHVIKQIGSTMLVETKKEVMGSINKKKKRVMDYNETEEKG
jgi:hypothetical protein